MKCWFSFSICVQIKKFHLLEGRKQCELWVAIVKFFFVMFFFYHLPLHLQLLLKKLFLTRKQWEDVFLFPDKPFFFSFFTSAGGGAAGQIPGLLRYCSCERWDSGSAQCYSPESSITPLNHISSRSLLFLSASSVRTFNLATLQRWPAFFLSTKSFPRLRFSNILRL